MNIQTQQRQAPKRPKQYQPRVSNPVKHLTISEPPRQSPPSPKNSENKKPKDFAGQEES
jgi:hypothetical protein